MLNREFTTQDISEQFNVNKTTAAGFVKFLADTRLIYSIGTRANGERGRQPTLYSASDEVLTMLNQITTMRTNTETTEDTTHAAVNE